MANSMGHHTSSPASHYSLFAKILHWGFVLLFAYGIATQINEADDLNDAAVFFDEILFASLFLLLLIIRFAYMSLTQKTALPDGTPAIQKKAAKYVHLAMYITLAAIALSGLLIGLVHSISGLDGVIAEAIIGLHEGLVSLIYGLIGLHVIAALYHRFRRDGVWRAMVPIGEKADRKHK